MSEKFRVGVDIGGTNVKIALVNNKGEISFPKTVPTRAEMGYEYTIGNIKQCIKDLMQEANITNSDLEGIGFGFPGQIDCDNGIIRILPNIPGWIDVPIAEIMRNEFNVPVKVDNDVRCMALAELNYGAGVGCKNLICITIGTGIGSGLVINGQLVRGASNAAGEIGHIKLEMHDGLICGCGDTGCFEAYASAPSIVAMAKDYVKGGKSTKFRELAGSVDAITPAIVYKAAQEGDVVAKKIFERMGEYLGIGLASVVNLLNPEKIVIGGGVADADDVLFEPLKKTLKDRAMPIQGSAVTVVKAELGNTAGLIGASLLIDN